MRSPISVGVNLLKQLQNVLPKCNPNARRLCYDRSTRRHIRRLPTMSFINVLCIYVVKKLLSLHVRQSPPIHPLNRHSAADIRELLAARLPFQRY